ncbi:auxin-induced protein X10A-like [Macadamia integrifolia]|uniref:auxin-induced protein X10A-like n=1 Tax=Macadamia integrifolia TaxID=60698 RepID=UPI001C52FF8A|nr:auxin-induced protein X10A-like [Macadamia integrifolia]
MNEMAKGSREILRKGGLVILRIIMEKLKRSLSLPLIRRWDDDYEELGSSMEVPQDVKEGQFVVFAVDGGETKRFVVDLGYLTHPEFLRMLQQAEEEFGFEQHGAIAVPCRPDDLQRILEDQRKDSGGARGEVVVP